MARTVAELRAALQGVDRAGYEALARALAADERKGVKQALAAARRRLDAKDAEATRLEQLYTFEHELAGGGVVVGLDEVGRGPVAGPVSAAAVILPDTPRLAGINDSKQLSEQRREILAAQIKEVALAWAVEHVEASVIDELGMAQALRQAFAGALSRVEAGGLRADAVLLDGNPLHLDPREKSVVKGDARCASIAAASILAKVERDALMRTYAQRWPAYHFESNKGYASAEHIAAIQTHGLCPIHRSTFCYAWTQETLF